MLFSRDAGLTVALRTLLPDEDRVVQLAYPGDEPGELDPGGDTVVLDFPRGPRQEAYTSIRQQFSGRIVILLLAGERDDSFDADAACVLLRRPFQLDDLSKELLAAGGGRRRGATARRGDPRPTPAAPAPPKAPKAPMTRPETPAAPRAPLAPPRPPVPPTAPPKAPAPPTAPASSLGRTPTEPLGPAGSPGTAPSGPVRPAPDAGRHGSVPGDRKSGSLPDDWFGGAAKPPPGSQEADWFTSTSPQSAAAGGPAPSGLPSTGSSRPEGKGAGAPPPTPGAGGATRPPGPQVRPYAAQRIRPSEAGLPRPAPAARPPAPGPGKPGERRAPEPGPVPGGNLRLGPGRDLLPSTPDLPTPPEPPGVGAGGSPGPSAAAAATRPGPAAGLRPPRPDPEARPRELEPWPPLASREAGSRPAELEPWPPLAGRKAGTAPGPSSAPGTEVGPPAPSASARPAEPATRSQPGNPGPEGATTEAAAADAPARLPRRKAREEAADGPARLPRRVVDLGGSAGRALASRSRPGAGASTAAAAAVRAPGPGLGALALKASPAAPGAVVPSRAAAGRTGPAASRTRAAEDHGPPPGRLLWRVAAAVLVAALAFLASAPYANRSPDASASEAAVVQVARNLARSGGLVWRGEPVLDQPPLALAAHGAWLSLSGRATGEVIPSIHHGRLASSAYRALAVGVLVLLVLALTEPARDGLLRVLVGLAAGLVAAFDPVLVGAGRMLTVESLGLVAALLALWLAWLLRDRPAAVYVPAVGLASGAALLADGRTVVLLVVPVVFGVVRGWPDPFAGRALAALLTGAGFWSAFAAWALTADPAPAGAGLSWPARLAQLVHLAGPDQPMPLGRPLALSAPRDLATLAVLGAALPALAALWRWRSDRASRFVLAWNLAGAAAGALLLAGGALDETWLTYLVPGAVAAVVLGFDAALARLASSGGTGRSLPGRISALTAPVLVAALLVLAGAGWNGRYGQPDDGLARMSKLVAGRMRSCSVLNASSPADPDLFSIGERRVAEFSSGSVALAHGVRYFLLRADDVAKGQGTMSAGLAGWLQAEGKPIVAVPSRSHGSVELWQVSQPSTSRVADLLRIPGGVFENTVGSGCGGFPVVDGDTGQFFSGYQAIGGKPVIGRPLSRSWQTNGPTLQAFDTMILGTVAAPDGGVVVRPVKLVVQLADEAPALLAASGMPKPETAPATTIQRRRQLLTDPRIARFYLGAPVEGAGPVVWQAADGRYGSPVSQPHQTATGIVRQAFERVVIEVDRDGSVQLAAVGLVAVRAGLVPAEALRPQPVPDLPAARLAGDPAAGSPGRLLAYLGAALGAWALLAATLLLGRLVHHLRRRARRGASAGAAAEPQRPPPAPSFQDLSSPPPSRASNGRPSGRAGHGSVAGSGTGDIRSSDPPQAHGHAGGGSDDPGAGAAPGRRVEPDRDGHGGPAGHPADRASKP